MGTLIVGLIVAIIIFLAAREVYKNRKKGSCCSGSNHDCNKCKFAK
ncbi:MAG: FeoB-associated Cys-rich membrane protein [Firmicutes bacterium]|nr:FeoB-associated Cys-rich membrane protein [Bacillota bacterium]